MSDYLGRHTDGPDNTYTSGGIAKKCGPYTAPASGVVNSIVVLNYVVFGATHFIAAIYASDGTRLGISGSTSVGGGGEVDCTLGAPVSVVSGTQYYLGYNADGDYLANHADGTVGQNNSYKSLSYPGMPANFTSYDGTDTNYGQSIWAEIFPSGSVPNSITGFVVATTGVTSVGTVDAGGASISATDYTKVILGGQATASSAITGLTVHNGTGSGNYTLSLSGLVVPGISITANFTDGAFTNATGPNAATGALTGTNNSTTIDLIVDAGTLSGNTATMTAAAVNANALIDHLTLFVNNASVGTFVTGGTASPVVGGDLITFNGYLADNTLIASGTLFTVASFTRISSTQVKAVLSGAYVLTPGTNGFTNSTWRDTTAGVNTNGFSSQDTASSGIWTFGSAFAVGDAWGFSTVPTYVMNMTGQIANGEPFVGFGVGQDILTINLV